MASAVAPSHGEIKKVAFASFIGTAIEWYDFFLYGTAASLVFPSLFFPEFSRPPQSCSPFRPTRSVSRRGRSGE